MHVKRTALEAKEAFNIAFSLPFEEAKSRKVILTSGQTAKSLHGLLMDRRLPESRQPVPCRGCWIIMMIYARWIKKRRWI